MRGKIYDRTAFIEAYLASRHHQFPINERGRFLKARLRSLERAFGVHISENGLPPECPKSLYMIFQGAVEAYVALRTDQRDRQDTSVLNVQIKQIGAPPIRSKPLASGLAEHHQASKQTLFEMVDKAFVMIWGPLDEVVRSEDLLRYGFDDSLEPEGSDYEL